ncbi:WD40/YVTN/BNR-like repeat-containing protein [Pontimicrobium sp. IMCC45349]|uniref:WD40/YVTN/BNR-like repeat-containing protein n=1 Tax=Pontimicrobium sp. IMCC45349 TaxID=3391574 RepID=UPI00399F5FE3
MRRILPVVLLVLIMSCKDKEVSIKPRNISNVEVEILLQDSLLNVRALEIDEDDYFGFATSNGKIGGKDFNFKGGNIYVNKENKQDDYLKESATVNFQIKHDTIIPNFRSLAATKNGGFVLGIGNPALLYKIDNDSIKLVYQESHPKAFYNSMDFWNDDEGIAMGDPTDDCMSIIITRDGGNTWDKLSCNDLPKIKEGEAAFAASDTNISIVGNHTWVATGGKVSRVLYSPDKGYTWEVYETPIVQGKPTTGIYSIDFYDELNGFAIGGDYTNPKDNLENKMLTKDGGKTWKLVAQNETPNYRSCVQYIPNTNGKELVAIGFEGIDFSHDAGNTWKHISDEGFYTIRFLNDSTAYAAGKGRISKLVFRE